MGVWEIDRFLKQWRMDGRDLHRRLIPAPAPRERALRQAQEMARHMAAGPRMDGFGYGAGPGTRSAHHRTRGRRLWRGRACRLDVRTVGGTPLTRVCKGFLRWDMASNLQVGLGFWPGFRQQPDAAPEPTLEEQPSEPVDAMSGYADGAARPAPGVAM